MQVHTIICLSVHIHIPPHLLAIRLLGGWRKKPKFEKKQQGKKKEHCFKKYGHISCDVFNYTANYLEVEMSQKSSKPYLENLHIFSFINPQPWREEISLLQPPEIIILQFKFFSPSHCNAQTQ